VATERRPLEVKGSDLLACRVLHEDGKYMTVEIYKDASAPLEVQDSDRFLMVLFVKARGGGPDGSQPIGWVPWEEASDAGS